MPDNKTKSIIMGNIDKLLILVIIKKKPIIPTSKELKENIPSRSAKLRYVIKKGDTYDFETDIFKKFQYLIEVENIGKKL